MTTPRGSELGHSGSLPPAGRDEVVAATLVAAADLFAERGPAATSIRDVASRAGINHGLIHRHLGSKDALVASVLDYLGQHLADLLAKQAPAEVVEAAIDRQLRVVARTILDGYPIGELQSRFPNVEQLLDFTRSYFDDDVDARLAAAHAIALPLSWRLFGAFLRAATGLKDLTEQQLDDSIQRTVDRIATGGDPARPITGVQLLGTGDVP
ncbi:TetR/AcrR family transcriptional regulator [Mycolicibacterium sphagni]|uniref:TetR family transcriptional regulator n=1 Tax=Mycolicibacterium sphagni TaxID=1786 RepID=A0A255DLL7_9MYCO|nr:helix-turn-helix domain-containing protein [Mycolicibacterium sphagni]OYN80288.1 TetR family transcriptional regulator [Mycolicibacterium sphagni]